MDATIESAKSQTRDLCMPDVIDELNRQHARITELMAETENSTPARRLMKLAELREFLIMHETAEQIIVRPVLAATRDPNAEVVGDTCDPAQRQRMVRQLQAAESSVRGPRPVDRHDHDAAHHQIAEPLNQIVERTYRAISDAV